MGKHITVAVAEDYELVREGIVSLLGKIGFEVAIQAKNGKDLIEKLGGSDTLPDVCIVDILMPEMNGYEAVSHIRKRWVQVKLLAISVLENPLPILKMIHSGAQGFIHKNNGSKAFKEAILSVYKGDYYFQENVMNQFKYWDGSGKIMGLNKEELRFLSFCPTELCYKEIASRMNKSERTVEGYAANLCKCLNVHTRIGLAMYAMSVGLTELA